MPEKTILMDGHILDSLLLPKVLDIVVEAGAEYEIEEIAIGRTRHDASRARIKITADDEQQLGGIVAQTLQHGAREA
jgi:hypothetical protein